ncbi:DNA protecting protein DprA [Comamonas sp. BIGb0124]|uniref:DNA-processing protein DprA n=1 Tax=Comamonas sp. BIGb0124 TaxID=2485130 RepID=UPI000F499119|nr:DNA-processing protein DprA [Comamonas sp. BIGb0124]ROR26211.1 DNA protecting protein DprA [Comamonas sp. BIGb0124]
MNAPDPHTADDWPDWLRLMATPGVGPDSARRLLAVFGLPQAIFAQTVAALGQVVSSSVAQALVRVPAGWSEHRLRTEQWLQAPGAPRALLALGHPAYPEALLALHDPPVLLYAMGRLACLPAIQPSVALIGSRHPTAQGEANSRAFARTLVQAGLTVVSGLARGIDVAAHEGALDGWRERPVDGRIATVAVVGTGLDTVYPKSHTALAQEICGHGLLISEYPLGTPPLAGNFPRRNRLIAGLALGTLVVEAALQSGSLITARLASEQGREVMAIPGSIHAVQSRGCHALIKQGAKLVECAQDVLEELVPQYTAPAVRSQPQAGAVTAHRREGGATVVSAATPADPRQGSLLAGMPGMTQGDLHGLLHALGHDPVGFDVLLARTGLDVPQLQVQLFELEMDGRVARLPGGMFQRLGH